MNREVAEGTCVQHITFLFEISFVDPMSLSYVPSRYYIHPHCLETIHPQGNPVSYAKLRPGELLRPLQRAAQLPSLALGMLAAGVGSPSGTLPKQVADWLSLKWTPKKYTVQRPHQKGSSLVPKQNNPINLLIPSFVVWSFFVDLEQL